MPETISLVINGKEVRVDPSATVAGAILQAGFARFRSSVTGAARGPLCGMGICFECRVTIDGVAQRLSCQTPCAPGMEVRTDVS